MGSPQIGRNTLPGNLSESIRAGITPTILSAGLKGSEEGIHLKSLSIFDLDADSDKK